MINTCLIKRGLSYLKNGALFLCLAMQCNVYALSSSDCVENGGESYCSMPRLTNWNYSICDIAGSFNDRHAAWCETWGGSYGDCDVAHTYELYESNLIHTAEQFTNNLENRDDCQLASDTGWGQSISYQVLCWSVEAKLENGLPISDARRLVVGCNKEGYEDFQAVRGRKFVCDYGAKKVTANGRTFCVREEEFSVCGLGNPILPLTGEKIQVEQDFDHPVMPLKRFYSSKGGFIPYSLKNVSVSYFGQFGAYWRTSFSYRLYAIEGALAKYALSYPDGRVDYFDADLKPVTMNVVGGYLDKLGEGFQFKKNGEEYVFDSNGYLKKLTTSSGLAYSFKYSGIDIERVESVTPAGEPGFSILPEGLLISVESDLTGLLYTFSYDAMERVVFARTPTERVTYSYDARDNLSKASWSSGEHKTYLYDDARFRYALTGIVDAEGNLYAEWGYDARGRANRSQHFGGREKVSLDFSGIDAGAASISVIGPLGKESSYIYDVIGGARRLTEIQGHASTNCAAANKEYDYYANGTLKSKTDWEGNLTTYVRDDLGREISRTEAAGTLEARTVTTEYHPAFNKPVKITEPGKVTTMTYDAHGRLISNTTQSTAAP